MPVQLGTLAIIRSLKYYATNPRRAFIVDRREWLIMAARRRMARKHLHTIYENWPSGAYEPDWADLENIYNLVRRRKPKVVIELGAGASTLMFGLALLHNARDGAPGHLYSIETSQYFQNLVIGRLPAEMKPIVDVLYSETAISQHDGINVLRHTTVPDVIPNLIYSDGPSFQPGCNVSADAVLMAETAGDDFAILIDGRGPTFRYTQKHIKGQYKVTVNRIHHWELLEKLPS